MGNWCGGALGSGQSRHCGHFVRKRPMSCYFQLVSLLSCLHHRRLRLALGFKESSLLQDVHFEV